jgi:hypothetical protein
MLVVLPLVLVPVHCTGKLLVIWEHSAEAMLAVVEPCALVVVTVEPFTVRLNTLRPHTSVQVWPEQSGSSDSPPLITAVPWTVWAAEPTPSIVIKTSKKNTFLSIFIEFFLSMTVINCEI